VGVRGDPTGEVLEHGKGFGIFARPDAVVDGGGGAVGEEDASGHDRELPFAEGVDNKGEVFRIIASEGDGISVETGEALGEDFGGRAVVIETTGIGVAPQILPAILVAQLASMIRVAGEGEEIDGRLAGGAVEEEGADGGEDLGWLSSIPWTMA
jgi:hypothetical protein